MKQEVKKATAMDMTTGRPSRLLIRFSLPLLIGNILQQIYNMVDSMVVGQAIGTNALGAVSIGFPIIYLLSSIFIGIGTGATIIISQSFGAGDHERVQRTVNTVYRVTLIGAVPMTILGLLLTRPLLELIAVPENLMEMATQYCLIIFAGLIGSFGYNINAGILQGLGDGKTPLLFLGVSSIINVALDILFVAGLNMGVAGAALATVIAQLFSWVFGIIYINKKIAGVQIRLLKGGVDKELFQRIIRLSVPSAIQQSQFAIAMIIMQWVVNGFGDTFIAGFAAANKIDAFAFMPIQSMSVAITTYVGQNMGAGDIPRVKRGVRDCVIISVLLCVIITLVVLPFMEPLLMLFINDSKDSVETIAAVLYTGRGYLIRVMIPMVLLAISFIINGALRGTGQAIVPMISAILSNWLVRVPFAYLLPKLTGVPENMFWCYGIGWLVGICISVPIYLRGRWQQIALTLAD